MRVAKVHPNVEFYVSVDVTDESPLLNENGYRYTPETIVVKFQGDTAAEATACAIPFAQVTRGRRAKANGTAGALIGREHMLFRHQAPEFYDRLVEAARNAVTTGQVPVVEMTDNQAAGREVRVVNPATGGQLFPGNGRTATRHEPEESTPPRGDVCVVITPSFRPGLPYDLATYPDAWVTDLEPPRTDNGSSQ